MTNNQSRDEIIVSDRYSAMGIPHPDPETVCRGQCEGVGFYPLKMGTARNITPHELEKWNEAHNDPKAHDDGPCDGWHFIECAECNGTGIAAHKAAKGE